MLFNSQCSAGPQSDTLILKLHAWVKVISNMCYEIMFLFVAIQFCYEYVVTCYIELLLLKS